MITIEKNRNAIHIVIKMLHHIIICEKKGSIDNMKDKRVNKIQNHFTVSIVGKKVKILNYKVKNSELILKTKIRGQSIPEDKDKVITICISENNQDIEYQCKWLRSWHTSKLDKHIFEIFNKCN